MANNHAIFNFCTTYLNTYLMCLTYLPTYLNRKCPYISRWRPLLSIDFFYTAWDRFAFFVGICASYTVHQVKSLACLYKLSIILDVLCIPLVYLRYLRYCQSHIWQKQRVKLSALSISPEPSRSSFKIIKCNNPSREMHYMNTIER
jgi:membrane-associated phospholipid phosphatase